MTTAPSRRRSLLAAAVTAVLVLGVLLWAVATRRPAAHLPTAAPPTAASPRGSSRSAPPPPATATAHSPAPSTAEPHRAALDATEACVRGTIDAMSRAELVGQVLMVGAPVDRPTALARTVARYHLGGVFLAGRSRRPAGDLRADLAALQHAAARPLLVALDQEGGSVQTLQGADFPAIASAQRLGRLSASALDAETRDTARRLAAIGVTINLAPVADTVPTGLGEDNPPIGAFHRQYGADPAAVADDIRTVVTASQQAGVLTTVKHFPGLGRVRANTDTSTRAVDATTDATDPYLQPFAAGIHAGSAAVMVSSARYPRLDPDTIAAYSEPIITGLLRGRLGFTGLVMSDDLGAAVAAGAWPTGERAVRFVRAGGDLVLTVRAQDAAPMTAALLAAVQASPSFADRVTDAARSVVRAKYRAKLLPCPAAG